jgi:hypothetical protein
MRKPLSKQHGVQRHFAEYSLGPRGLSQICGANNSNTKTAVTLKWIYDVIR